MPARFGIPDQPDQQVGRNKQRALSASSVGVSKILERLVFKASIISVAKVIVLGPMLCE